MYEGLPEGGARQVPRRSLGEGTWFRDRSLTPPTMTRVSRDRSMPVGGTPDDAAAMIAALGMRAHPEGGWYAETWRPPRRVGERPPRQRDRLPPCRRRAIALASGRRRRDLAVLGRRSARAAGLGRWGGGGHRSSPRWGRRGRLDAIQAVVPAGAWQAARPLGAWTLVGCIVTPAFEFAGFELAAAGWEPPIEPT